MGVASHAWSEGDLLARSVALAANGIRPSCVDPTFGARDAWHYRLVASPRRGPGVRPDFSCYLQQHDARADGFERD